MGKAEEDKLRVSDGNFVNFLPPSINLALSVPLIPTLTPVRAEESCLHLLPGKGRGCRAVGLVYTRTRYSDTNARPSSVAGVKSAAVDLPLR